MGLKLDKSPADERQRARGAVRAPITADCFLSVMQLAAQRRRC
jgi:hypothetical protein